MTTALLTQVARDSLRDFLKEQLPGQIAAVNTVRLALDPETKPLAPIVSWAGSPLVAKPETPAVYVLPQTSGFRGTQLAVDLDERHSLYVYVAAGDQDEEAVETDLMGYVAAVVGCLLQNYQSRAPMPNGAQVLPGHGTGAEEFIVYGPNRPEAELFYADCYVAVTVFLSEVL